MRKEFDINNWNRREHFEFFKTFEEPFTGINTDIECTSAYKRAKSEGISFFQIYLHAVVTAANSVENMRLRIEGDKLYLYDKLNISTTVAREDHTFGFSFIEYNEELKKFSENCNKEIERVKATTGLCLSEESERADSVHFTAIPWIKMTSIYHARMFSYKDSIPKFAVGKLYERDNKYFLPFSLHVHHALCDAYHIGLVFQKIESILM